MIKNKTTRGIYCYGIRSQSNLALSHAVVAGFIDSIAGGGGLIAMPAYMMCGMPMYYVYGCNKFQCAFGSTAAAYKYFKSGCLDLKITAVSAVSSFLCSF